MKQGIHPDYKQTEKKLTETEKKACNPIGAVVL